MNLRELAVNEIPQGHIVIGGGKRYLVEGIGDTLFEDVLDFTRRESDRLREYSTIKPEKTDEEYAEKSGEEA